jgi:hypothetical protein
MVSVARFMDMKALLALYATTNLYIKPLLYRFEKYMSSLGLVLAEVLDLHYF